MGKPRYLYVYILKCSDESYYTGVTNNPERRLKEHNSGINLTAYTHSRRPVERVFLEKFSDFLAAISFEKKLKRWSHKKKEALINNNFELLKEYAACRNETSSRLRSM